MRQASVLNVTGTGLMGRGTIGDGSAVVESAIGDDWAISEISAIGDGLAIGDDLAIDDDSAMWMPNVRCYDQRQSWLSHFHGGWAADLQHSPYALPAQWWAVGRH